MTAWSPGGSSKSQFVTSRRRRWVIGSAVALLAAVGGGLALRAQLTPVARELRLTDGTQVFFLSNTHVQPVAAYPEPREIRIDGEAFIRAAADDRPLIVHTRLLVLTVTGSAAFRVTADSKSTGEEVDVLEGKVQAKKSYPSPQSEPDDLVGGEIVMINETIDLQEKETGNLPQLRAWSAALSAAAVPKR